MKKENKYSKILRKISAYILMLIGLITFLNPLEGFDSTTPLFPIILTILGGIALIFLGIYILRNEHWAFIIAGVYGIVAFVNGRFIAKLFGLGGWMTVLFNIAYLILIINWFFNDKNAK